ncbi:hypothetical protein EDB83DRAFT_2477435 [Lactarius deliciosus]|nr:hypothetical protein EDB83DRAFT_2477435 [Lactarius deliciosus]
MRLDTLLSFLRKRCRGLLLVTLLSTMEQWTSGVVSVSRRPNGAGSPCRNATKASSVEIPSSNSPQGSAASSGYRPLFNYYLSVPREPRVAFRLGTTIHLVFQSLGLSVWPLPS